MQNNVYPPLAATVQRTDRGFSAEKQHNCLFRLVLIVVVCVRSGLMGLRSTERVRTEKSL